MCYVLRADKFVMNLMIDDFCQSKSIPAKDKEKLLSETYPMGDLFQLDIDSTITENLLFFVIEDPFYKDKCFTDYPHENKVVGFASRSSLQKAIDSFNQSQPDYYIDSCADDAKFVRCSTGIIYQVPVDNYFLAQLVLNFAKKNEVLNSFIREGYERV